MISNNLENHRQNKRMHVPITIIDESKFDLSNNDNDNILSNDNYCR